MSYAIVALLSALVVPEPVLESELVNEPFQTTIITQSIVRTARAKVVTQYGAVQPTVALTSDYVLCPDAHDAKAGHARDPPGYVRCRSERSTSHKLLQ